MQELLEAPLPGWFSQGYVNSAISDNMSWDSCSCTQENILHETSLFQSTEPKRRALGEAGWEDKGENAASCPYHTELLCTHPTILNWPRFGFGFRSWVRAFLWCCTCYSSSKTRNTAQDNGPNIGTQRM